VALTGGGGTPAAGANMVVMMTTNNDLRHVMSVYVERGDFGSVMADDFRAHAYHSLEG